MSKKLGVFIGRFQPVHLAHEENIREALKEVDQLIIIIGSAFRPRSIKNPFTWYERSLMLSLALGNDNIKFEAVRDYPYSNSRWVSEVQTLVDKHVTTGDSITLFGCGKDSMTTRYLKDFPQWKFKSLPVTRKSLSATTIRDILFSNIQIEFIKSVVSENVYKYLLSFSETEDWAVLKQQGEFIKKYKEQFASYPYPPIFSTVDSVVIQSGNVLLVKRKAQPGKGLWALPGGFIDANKDASVEDAMIRELFEETNIQVPEKVLRGSIKGQRVFDDIERSERGRTITHAFSIILNNGEWALPKVKGTDDAEKAEWVPISHVKSEKCFDDHYDIIEWALGNI